MKKSTVDRVKIIKTVCIVSACIIACGILALIITNHIVVDSSKHGIIGKEEAKDIKADAIMVFGARVHGDSLSMTLRSRVDTAIALYKAGAAPKLLMTGDHGRTDYDEVNAMKKYAIEQGVPKKDIFCDHAGFSTYESIYRSRDVFECRKLILVTQEFHIYRTIYLAKALGIEGYGVVAPNGINANNTYNSLRELLARTKAVADSIFLPKPTYLGEVIPISGNGCAADDRSYEVE